MTQYVRIEELDHDDPVAGATFYWDIGDDPDQRYVITGPIVELTEEQVTVRLDDGIIIPVYDTYQRQLHRLVSGNYPQEDEWGGKRFMPEPITETEVEDLT